MKKIISAILAASLSLSCMMANVHAESRTIGINAALSNPEEIHILYNDTVVKYEDVKPVNYEDRIMIPFRAALESMGATVDYDDATRTVTASKGDTTITFALLDDTIYINAGGEESTITMDVPMIIVNDRTLVPIRFMSNALGMQVGWDGETETVVIVDADDYLSEFAKKAPNLYRISQLDENDLLNKANLKLSMTCSMMGQSMFSADMNADVALAGNTASAEVNLGVNSPMFTLDKSDISVVVNGDTVYIKTNIIEQLSKSVPSLDEAVKLVDSNGWYSVNVAELFEGLGIDEMTSKMLEAALSAEGQSDIETILGSMLATEGDAVFDDVVRFAQALDMLEAIDKYIVINETDGGYTVTVDITPEEFVEIINVSLGSLMGDETMQSILDELKYSLNAKLENNGSTATVSVKLDVESPFITMTLNADETAEYDPDVLTLPVPAESEDITGFILSAAKASTN